MSILQNALFKSKLLKAIDSAMGGHEEVDLESFTVHSINYINHAGRLHNEVDGITNQAILEYQLSKNPVKQRPASIH